MVLGVDPGTARMGYGFVELHQRGLSLVTYGVVTTAAGIPLPRRLQTLYEGLLELIDRHRPDEAAIEQLFFARNVQSALAVGQARGVVLLALANRGVPIAEYTPLQVKQAVVGYGRGDKPQIQTMIKMLLDMDHLPKPDDAADALAIALCHIHNRRMANMIGGASGAAG